MVQALSIVLRSTGPVANVPLPGASDPIRASHTGSKLRWLVGRSKQSVRRTVSRGSNSASNGGTRRRRRVPPGGPISTTGRPSPTAATMIDMRHGPLPTQDEAKWQLDFLACWKAKKYFIYSEGAIELGGYPVLNPEGRFSEEQIRRINTTILNQVGPNQDALRTCTKAGRSVYGDSW